MPIQVTKELRTPTEFELAQDWRQLVWDGMTEQSFKAYRKAHKDDIVSEEYYWDESNQEFDAQKTPISAQAATLVALAITTDAEQRDFIAEDVDEAISIVVSFNDSTLNSRTQVLDAFQKAIDLK
jgi:hypothetical protein